VVRNSLFKVNKWDVYLIKQKKSGMSMVRIRPCMYIAMSLPTELNSRRQKKYLIFTCIKNHCVLL